MKYKKDPKRWSQLSLLSNCFNDKTKTHLGVRHKGRYYCITHNGHNEKVIIEKKHLDMKEISPNIEYLKRVYNSVPKILNTTQMSISKEILNYYIGVHGRDKKK
jgi:hypothetical protein|tara:strand:- start:1852 stop:2163 length:312 start_codon:yes stop_codon:yes gene_type:complete